jgi:hypothetical protein
VFLTEQITVDAPVADVRRAVVSWVRDGGLRQASREAYAAAEPLLLAAGCRLDPGQLDAPTLPMIDRGDVDVLAFSWVVTDAGGHDYQPVDGNLELEPVDDRSTTVRVVCVYRPPQNADPSMVNGHRFGEAAAFTLRVLLRSIGEASPNLAERELAGTGSAAT